MKITQLGSSPDRSRVGTVTDMKSTYGHQNYGLHFSRQIYQLMPLCLTCQQQTLINTELSKCYYSLWRLSSQWVLNWLYQPPSILEGPVCPLRRRYLLCVGFAFFSCRDSASTTIKGLTECLVHRHGIPRSIASGQGTHFTVKELWECAHWSNLKLHHPEAAKLIHCYNSLLKL